MANLKDIKGYLKAKEIDKPIRFFDTDWSKTMDELTSRIRRNIELYMTDGFCTPLSKDEGVLKGGDKDNIVKITACPSGFYHNGNYANFTKELELNIAKRNKQYYVYLEAALNTSTILIPEDPYTPEHEYSSFKAEAKLVDTKGDHGVLCGKIEVNKSGGVNVLENSHQETRLKNDKVNKHSIKNDKLSDHSITENKLDHNLYALKPGDILISFDREPPKGFRRCWGELVNIKDYPLTFKKLHFTFGHGGDGYNGRLEQLRGTGSYYTPSKVSYSTAKKELRGRNTRFTSELRPNDWIVILGSKDTHKYRKDKAGSTFWVKLKVKTIVNDNLIKLVEVPNYEHDLYRPDHSFLNFEGSIYKITKFRLPDVRGYGLRFFARTFDNTWKNKEWRERYALYPGGNSTWHVGSYQDDTMQKHKHYDSGHKHGLHPIGSMRGDDVNHSGGYNAYAYYVGNLMSQRGKANLDDAVKINTNDPDVRTSFETRMKNIYFDCFIKVDHK